jgi:NCAIR mutase (PurE)-related protein
VSSAEQDALIRFDFHRRERVGVAEAVLCAGKTTELVERIAWQVHERGQRLLLTRLDPRVHAALSPALQQQLDYEPLSHTAVLGPLPETAGPARVAIVSAGTSDARVAREASRTLAFDAVAVQEIHDVGVAGLWRLLERAEELREIPVVIAVAGMDAALVSVLGGLLSQVVIAVPTSTGYGACRDGETALAASLVSCASGVTVCNIDNGYGAACAALRVLRSLGRLQERAQR